MADLSFPEDITRRPGFIRFTPVKHDGGFAGDSIELPLPPVLTFNDTIVYENFDMGIGGQLIETFAQAGGGQAGLEAAREQYAARYTDEGLVAGASQLTSDILTKIGSNAGRLAKGKTPNPDTRSLFKQPNLRSVGFNFKMVVTDPKEPNKIRRIVKRFRKHMYPSKDGDGPNIFYRFPDKFRIMMFLGHPSATIIPPFFHYMYLTTCNVSYGGGVLASNNSNHWFAETDLQLSFTEEKTLMQNDIEAGW